MENGWHHFGLTILLLAITAIGLTACGETSPLVGKWQYTEGVEAYIEFFNDGQMEMGDGYSTMIGTYEETGDKEVTLTLLSINGEDVDEEEQVVLKYSISGDDLTMDDGEYPITFTRME
jgi:ABC-type glycerol-3-phosphate transport system substrate-binding protein